MTALRFVLPLMFLSVVVPSPAPAQTAATTYLQSASDRYQHTVDVYSIADAAGNHFAARGEFDANNGLLIQVPAMDEISTSAPCLLMTCITATYDPTTVIWGGWYFLNGILGPSDRVPSANWGNIPNAGYDLTGAAMLQFWARGQVGGERVQFFTFGVGNTTSPFQPYPDSAPRTNTPVSPITLSTTWTQYQIPLSGVDDQYVLGGFGWVAVQTDQANQTTPITFYLDNIQYVKERPSDPRLLVSYETIKSTNTFDSVMRNAAFTYDNAVALIALAAAGDTARGQYTADALLYGQANDRFFTDNRLRNAYQGGDVALPPGWLPNNKANTVRMPGWYDPGRTTWFEDATQVSSNTGNIAWAMIASLYLYDATQQQKYLHSAQLLGDWVINNTSAAVGPGFTGGFDGWENGAASSSSFICASNDIVNGQCKRHYKATEHNIDLYAAFSHLYLRDNSAKWALAAQQAKAFFLSMWNPSEGKFWTGTLEDEVTISTAVIPLDIQVWSLEALGSEDVSFLPSLAYIEANHKTTNGYGFKQDGGNSCGDNTWFEGTSQVALAYELNGNTAKAKSILDAIHAFQNSTGSVQATDAACLNTGFTLNDGSPWLYYPRAHVGATAWLSLAEGGTNPFRSDLYSPLVSPTALTFSNQNTGTTSSALTVLVTNRGAAPFLIDSTTISGLNPSDFSVLSNGCGSTVAIESSCTLSVLFNPQAVGSRSATLAIAEQASASIPALSLPSVQLSGTGCAFSLSAGQANPPSVSDGGSSTATVTVTPSCYTGTMTLACSITPVVSGASAPTCGFSPNPVSVTSSTVISTMLTFNAVGSSGAVFQPPTTYYARRQTSPATHVYLSRLRLVWLPIPALTLIGFGLGSRASRRKKLSGVLRISTALAGVIFMTSCGGQQSNPPTLSGTPRGTYTISITGKDANGTVQNGVAATVVVVVD
jgi:hypothetical protein